MLIWQHAGSYPGYGGYHRAYIDELKLMTVFHVQHCTGKLRNSQMFNREVNKQDLHNYLKKLFFFNLNCSLTAALCIQRPGHN